MAKAIREGDGKSILARRLQALTSESKQGKESLSFPVRAATVTAGTDFAKLAKENPWLETEVSPLTLFVWKRSSS